ncbi:hypothetical protein GCM10011282_13660 [Undibacterium macrobrachii]|uniref:Uncharacterized protein n=1 Tax=Undibacterium macrobrachii TaxID=1119058 RepID=A0ABQ2XBE4_9BURK|nr:hypothetical protein GCM10011282_13660 [Undibacterium macrobrachii]
MRIDSLHVMVFKMAVNEALLNIVVILIWLRNCDPESIIYHPKTMIKILENSKEHLSEFIRLNEE